LNIAFVVTDLADQRIGGISKVATEVAANLVAQGHRVVAYVLRREGMAEWATYRGIEVRTIAPFASLNPDYPVQGFSGRAWRQVLADADRERWDVVQGFNLNDLALPKVAGALKAKGVAVIHGSFETLGMDVGAKWREFRSLPSLQLLAQILYEGWLKIAYEKRMVGCADAIITEDANTRAALATMGVPAPRMHLVPSGIDVAEVEAAQRADLVHLRRGSGPLIGYLGRVDPRKGVQYLISAMAEVGKRHPDVVLFLAGGSRQGYERSIRSHIAQLGLEEHVHLLGRIPGSLYPYYKGADLVVIPSLSEGIPITLGEAMAAQVPAVITRLPGVIPFVEPSDLVHWCDIADVPSLTQAILAGLDDSQRNERVEAAYNFILGYTWDAVARRYARVFESVRQGQTP